MARYIDADAYEFPGDLIHVPTAEVEEVRHSVWLTEKIERGVATYYRGTCVLCGRTVARCAEKDILELPYCHCGAKMDGGVTDGNL